ncbi:hypothetical protein ACWEKM_41800 [Streptomyces sp. NPDC004752]
MSGLLGCEVKSQNQQVIFRQLLVIDCASPQRARAIAERVLDFHDFHAVAIEVRPIHGSFHDSFGMSDTMGYTPEP